MGAIVVEHADLKTRACIDSSAAEHYRLRGWEPVGPAAENGALETVQERQDRIVAEAAAERALLDSKPRKPSARRVRGR